MWKSVLNTIMSQKNKFITYRGSEIIRNMEDPGFDFTEQCRDVFIVEWQGSTE